ncbi:hypothetical protein ACIP88_13185 [Streptomyces uncialis]|uniref:imine reductase family protein n=1 Tax=Streptomyces uncialis TaxID=1048205 RepID=UPI0037F529A2
MRSGSASALERHEETLGHLGNPVCFGEDPGPASLYDVALLDVMWGTLNAFPHGAALPGTAKADASVFAHPRRPTRSPSGTPESVRHPR